MDKKCNGLGFYDLDVPVGHPDFNKVFRCPNNPRNEDDNRIQRLTELSNLGAFENITFDDFQLNRPGLSDKGYQSLKSAYDAALRFAENPGQRWIVFEGTYGTGKTHLAAAIGNARLSAGDVVLFITAPDLLDHLRGAYSPNAETTYDETFNRVRSCELLILDDLGVENPSQWSKEKLFQLLNYRYNQEKSTVITTNTDIDRLDPRLRSRMLDESIVEHRRIAAPDYRSLKQNTQEQLSDLHLYDEYRLDTFDTRAQRPEHKQNLERAVQIGQQYVEGGYGWLVLMGNSGTGKTHLAAAIGNHWQQQGGEVMFVTVPDLLDYLRRTFDPSSNVSFDDQFQQVKNAPLLVLDDLSAMRHTKQWSHEKLLQIIKHRYVRRLPTVITTAEPLENLDDQVRTRLLDSRLCHIFAITTAPYVDRIRRR